METLLNVICATGGHSKFRSKSLHGTGTAVSVRRVSRSAEANSCCLQSAVSQQAVSLPASQRRWAQPAATASLRMPLHCGSPTSSYGHRLATRFPSGLATIQMGSLGRKPGTIVFPGAILRARTEVKFGSDAPTRRVSLFATSVTTSQPTSPRYSSC